MRVVGYGMLCSGDWSVVVLLVSKFQSSRLLVFCEDVFFLYLLSPFIFNAGPWSCTHDVYGYLSYMLAEHCDVSLHMAYC
ncbi:hypothetical protein RGQ29_031964 [Quercus rubra]|uniref:Uncharacterized protein n=1 Tax=Quercus rubra TaxID=3512 RepID=A0AAN7DT64_QUERU|nr:hypothetical protein RGQ29_031964 [Quercus rubra]